MNIELRAKADIPGLRRSLRRISRLARKLVYSQRFCDDDHLGFMVLVFLSKLVEQARSVRILIRKGAGRDAELVSRSMMEAMASLLWASRKPDDRAFKWRGFAFVEDFRLMEEQRASGQSIDPANEKAIGDFLKREGGRFVIPKRAGKPDPYYANWRCGASVRDAFEEVGGIALYEKVYGPSSDWIHSGTASAGSAIRRSGKSVTWNRPSSSVIARSLATAFQSIAESLKLAVDHFDNPLEKRLTDIVETYKTRFPSSP